MQKPGTVYSIHNYLIVLLLIVMPVAADSPPELGSVNAAFELVNGDGDVVRFDDYAGQNVLLAFGFTNCVHICPMIAANMARAIDSTDKNVIGIFISVDTERDSPAKTHAYARKFGENMVGLSGSHQQVSDAAQNFGVSYVVTKSQNNYTVQHTPSIFLIGPDGELVDTFAMNTPSADIVAAMQ
jgi:protein SCO1/2